MNERSAAAYGFVLAPISPAVILAALGPTTGNPATFGWITFWLLTGYMYAAFAATIFGIPLFLLLRKFNAVRWWSAVPSGIVIGIAMALVLGISSTTSSSSGIALFAIEGAAAATTFWIVYAYLVSRKTKDRHEG